MSLTLDDINQFTQDDAFHLFQQTCAAERWCDYMVNARPYASLASIHEHAQRYWQQMSEDDIKQAFLAHPMIGDVSTLREKFANTKSIASNEQSGTAQADEAVLTELHELNHRYLKQNGFIFIICATGLSAQFMLDALRKRILHEPQTELLIAAAEQIKITLLRLEKVLVPAITGDAS